MTIADPIVLTFCRCNPPHIGHDFLFKEMEQIAYEYGGDFKVCLSRTKDKEKNPLWFHEKLNFLREVYPHWRNNFIDWKFYTDPFKMIEGFINTGYQDIIFVCGPDRFISFNTEIIKHYGDKINSLQVIPVGSRSSSSIVEAASGTAMRQYAQEANFPAFWERLPTCDEKTAEQIYNRVRKEIE